MSRILVTGGGGFIGRPALAILRRAGHEVHATSRNLEGEDRSGVCWHRVDLLDADCAAEAAARVKADGLLHLAWIATPGQYWTSPDNERWVTASLGLLRGFAAGGGGRVVVAGSCAEYEWGTDTYGERTTPLRPATLYGECKHALNMAASDYCREAGLSFAWGRLFSVYGPHEPRERLVPTIARTLLADAHAEYPAGDRVRDFLFVEDAADALGTLLGSELEGAFNVASGERTSLRSAALALADAAGVPGAVTESASPPRPDEPRVLVADASRLRDELGWAPSILLAEGTQQTVDYWRKAA